MAQQLADLGYAVLLPNMYYRVGEFEPFDVQTVFSDPDERARLMALASSVTKDAATRDTGAFLDFLAAQPRGGRHEGRARPGTAWAAGSRSPPRDASPIVWPRRRRSTAAGSPPPRRTARTCWPAP